VKTLLGIYTGLLGRAEAVQEKAVLQWVETEKKKHKAPVAYWLKKKIITENLFGVDIMEEAVEIAKLRLFLALVASVERRDHLEPLPNIEFNLMHGNSLIGLLHVDPKKFDSTAPNGSQGRMTLVHQPTPKDLGFAVESKAAPTTKEKVGAHLAEKRAKKYAELLREKNRLVDLYKRSALDFEDLTALKESIETKKREARGILDKLLLDEFHGLAIQFEEATWDEKKGKEGKPQRRKLKLDDVQALYPFHWAYEFDEIVVGRGGFDAIITNPPWDAFKPNSKEFFTKVSRVVTKKKMSFREFEKEKVKILRDRQLRSEWLIYLGGFPHVSAWFRSAPQFVNQSAVVDGRKTSSDLNLYKLFTEQAFNLLRAHGCCSIIDKAGIYSHLGSTGLRRLLLTQCELGEILGFSNEKFLFDGVHHAERFAIVSFSKHGTTNEIRGVFRINPREAVRPRDLESFLHDQANRVSIKLTTLQRFSPETLSLMEFKTNEEVRIVEKLFGFPLLQEPVDSDWEVSWCNELHMNQDADLFFNRKGAGMLPLAAGKTFNQYEFSRDTAKFWLDEKSTRRRILGSTTDAGQLLDYQHYRLAFRDVASNTNERTMIATVLPPEVFCPHTVSLEKLPTSKLNQIRRLGLVALFNAFVTDFIVRQKVTNHVSFFFVYQLPIPRLSESDPRLLALTHRAARLIGRSAEFDDLLKEVFGRNANHRSHGVTNEAKRSEVRAEIDAIIAHLYNLTEEEFAYILSTFPLVPQETKTLVLNTFIATLPTADDRAVHKLIKDLETDKVEFKEGAAYGSQRRQKSPDMIRNVLREVAAFLNCGGGNVILGVTDAGKIVGIADDVRHADPKKKNHDGYELFLRNSISGKLGTIQSSSCKISFHKIDNLEVCRIFVPAFATPVYLEGNLIIRDGTSSRQLSTQEAAAYIAQHWPHP
jgi:hypothetical protein